MREILFRGKRIDNGEWVEGYFVHVPCGRFLSEEYLIQTIEEDGRIGQLHTVYESTVEQFTGLTDKNGKRIFEGDIVRSFSSGKEHIGIVNWNRLFSSWHIGEFATLYGSENFSDNEVIGNIHDNPELLEAD